MKFFKFNQENKLIKKLLLEKRKCIRLILAHPIKYTFYLFLIFYLAAMFSMLFLMEKNLKEALLLTAPAAFGEIETGFVSMDNIWDPFIIIFCLLLNVILLGVILAYANDYVRNLSLQGGRIEKNVDYKDHIVICGWNYQGNDIINALQSKDIHSNKEIVVLADHEKRPFKQEGVVSVLR